MAVELMKLPDSMFSDVLKKKEVIKVMLLNRNDKKALKEQNQNYDGCDVLILNGFRKNELMSRDTLLSNYMNSNGRKIRLTGWHYHKPYTVIRITKEQAKVLKIPKRSRFAVTLNGCDLPKPCLVLCNVVNDQIDKRNPRVISNTEDIKEFRKMYRVIRLADTVKARSDAHERNMINQIQIERKESLNKKVWSPKTQQVQQDELSKAPYEAVGRALNRAGVQIGFIIRDKRTSKIDVYNLQQVKRLCVDKKVCNLTIVYMQDTGKEHFRGVGIKVANLPSKQYNI